MGMGEPLLNLDRVLSAIEALNDPNRFGLGARVYAGVASGDEDSEGFNHQVKR